MQWQDLFAALALYFVLEGILPFVAPDRWREAAAMLARLSNNQLRIMGLVSMGVGLILLLVVRG